MVLLILISCGGGGDNLITDPASLQQLQDCARDIQQSDSEVTVCDMESPLPNGFTLNEVVSDTENGITTTFYPNGEFEQIFGECRLTGEYVLTNNNCVCSSYSIQRDTTFCGVLGRNRHAACNRCFTSSEILELPVTEDSVKAHFRSMEILPSEVFRLVAE